MCEAVPSPDLRDSMCFVQVDEQKNLGQDPALREKRDREGAKTRKAAASRLRRNSKAPSALMSLTEFLGRAVQGSSASFETQLLLPVMFQVSISWVEIPFVNRGISLSNASGVPRTRFTREEELWSSICAGRKRGKNSRILREFTKNKRPDRYPRD